MKNIEFRSFTGKDIEPIIDIIASFRITLFREYPYLYDGDIKYEKEYLSRYIESKDSCVFLAYSAGTVVGACTCQPLVDEMLEIYKPLETSELSIKSCLYIGEFLISKTHQGLGLARKFDKLCQNHGTKVLPHLSHQVLCTVKRLNHPLKPVNYDRSSGPWESLGYKQLDNFECQLSWKDVDKDVEDLKSLDYWVRKV